jgi:hypothetical protein
MLLAPDRFSTVGIVTLRATGVASVDTLAFQAAIASVHTLGGGTVLASGAFKQNATIFVPADVAVVGNADGSTSITPVTGSFAGGFMFGLNTTDCVHWQSANPLFPAKFENIYFKNDPAVSPIIPIRGIVAFGPYDIRGIRGYNMTNLITRAPFPASGSTGEYNDAFRITRCYAFGSNTGSEYQIEISGGGEGLVIDQCDFDPGINAIRFNYGSGNACYSALLCNGINGNIYINHSFHVDIQNWHFENSIVTVDAANVKFDNCNFSMNSVQSSTPIVTLEDTNTAVFSVVLDHVLFRWGGLFKTPIKADVQVSARCLLKVNASYRAVDYAGGNQNLNGIKLSTDTAGATPVSEWNNLSHLLSKSGVLNRQNKVAFNHTITNPSTAWPGVYAISTVNLASSGNHWGASLGTYYYTAAILYDVTNLVGKAGTGFGTPEYSATIADLNHIISLNISFANTVPWTGLVRLYRGTSAGSYTSYVDIPYAAAGDIIYDDGLYANGIAWEARAASGIDALIVAATDRTLFYTEASGFAVSRNKTVVTGDADTTQGISSQEAIYYGSPISADRTVTLPNGAFDGDTWTVTRAAAATGAFNVNVKRVSGTTLKALAVGQWAVFNYSANNGAWVEIQFGSL